MDAKTLTVIKKFTCGENYPSLYRYVALNYIIIYEDYNGHRDLVIFCSPERVKHDTIMALCVHYSLSKSSGHWFNTNKPWTVITRHIPTYL